MAVAVVGKPRDAPNATMTVLIVSESASSYWLTRWFSRALDQDVKASSICSCRRYPQDR
jgi:hypothetical protein